MKFNTAKEYAYVITANDSALLLDLTWGYVLGVGLSMGRVGSGSGRVKSTRLLNGSGSG